MYINMSHTDDLFQACCLYLNTTHANRFQEFCLYINISHTNMFELYLCLNISPNNMSVVC